MDGAQFGQGGQVPEPPGDGIAVVLGVVVVLVLIVLGWVLFEVVGGFVLDSGIGVLEDVGGSVNVKRKELFKNFLISVQLYLIEWIQM